MKYVETLTMEQVNQLDSMIRGITYRRKHILPREVSIEDAISELWIVAVECINSMRSVEMNLIAKKCYSKLVDLVRESVRRSCYDMDVMSFERLAEEEDEGCERVMLHGRQDRPDDYLIVKEILSLFEEGTKEREYVMLMIHYSNPGMMPGGEDVDDDHGIDGYISKKLGYASSSSSGYTRMRGKVRSLITLYENGANFDDLRRLRTLGFKNYDDCLGWKNIKRADGSKALLEVYMSSGSHTYDLYIDSEKVLEFDRLDDLISIIATMKGR